MFENSKFLTRFLSQVLQKLLGYGKGMHKSSWLSSFIWISLFHSLPQLISQCYQTGLASSQNFEFLALSNRNEPLAVLKSEHTEESTEKMKARENIDMDALKIHFTIESKNFSGGNKYLSKEFLINMKFWYRFCIP